MSRHYRANGLLSAADGLRRYPEAKMALRHGPGTTLQHCARCGTEKPAVNMLSSRVPGVGMVYRCRGCE